MLHPQLEQQLCQLGIGVDNPPDPQTWARLLSDISKNYTAHQATELELAENRGFFESMYEAAHRQALELTLMFKVRNALGSQLDLDDVIRTVVEETANTLGYGLASLYMIEGNELVLKHQIGYSPDFYRFPLTRGVMGRVARTGEAVLIEDVKTDPDCVAVIEGLTSEICIPLHNAGHVVGVLNIETKDGRKLTREDFDLVWAVGLDVEIAIEQARLYTALRDSIEKYHLVVDNVREIIFRIDLDGRWTFLNNAWERLSGYSLDESLGQHVSRFLPPDELRKSRGLGGSLIKSTEPFVRFPTFLRRRDGTDLPVETHMQAVRDDAGHPLFITGTIADISDRVQKQQQAMELMLKARTVESLRGFLSGVSHDLRTPLSTINTTVYLLRRRLENHPGEERYLDRLEEQVGYLTRAVEDMMEMSHLDEESFEFTFVQTNLNTLIRDVLYVMEPMAQNKQQHINFICGSDPLLITADQMMLGKVVRNLLKNAINYTPAEGVITIRALMTDTTAIIEVEDTGIGIEQADLSLIFDRFYKANKARTAGSSGTGLGLSIVKKIIEAHHGTVEVTSELGRGSTFRVILPVNAEIEFAEKLTIPLVAGSGA